MFNTLWIIYGKKRCALLYMKFNKLNRDSLSKPASLLYRHNLTSILETAVRSSNAQFDDPDILNRLGVQLLEVR